MRPESMEHKEAAGGVTYRVFISSEDIPIRGNAISSGDDAYDEKVCARIESELESGNLWAWCLVRVECSAAGLSESDYLGGCSYRDVAEFLTGGYYESMKDEARAGLESAVERAQLSLS